MLKVELTENYAGIKVWGDYNDLDFLYDSINYLVHGEPSNEGEYLIQNHIYAFLYDLRHAYQGSREINIIDNSLNDFTRANFKLKKKDVTDKNVYFGFNYLIPDALLDIMIIKFLMCKVPKKENDIFNPYINMVNFFYALVLNSLDKMLTVIKFNKVKKGLIDSILTANAYLPQWYEMVTCDYIRMSKEKRKKEFMHIADAIYNFYLYEDYIIMVNRFRKMCNEKNCSLDNFHYEYPEEIIW